MKQGYGQQYKEYVMNRLTIKLTQCTDVLQMDYVILGLEAALGYHGLCHYDYYNYPVILSTDIPENLVIGNMPALYGVKKYPQAEATRYENVGVIPWHLAFFDTLAYNEYSEELLQVLRNIENDEEKMKLLYEEAARRNMLNELKQQFEDLKDYMF